MQLCVESDVHRCVEPTLCSYMYRKNVFQRAYIMVMLKIHQRVLGECKFEESLFASLDTQIAYTMRMFEICLENLTFVHPIKDNKLSPRVS